MTNERAMRPEVWAGIECTVNRVGEEYFDQLALSGHAVRDDDIERIAELEVSAVRYPILWERTEPADKQSIDWSWPDKRLNRLREVGINPVVGLVHHGSGPRHTSLVESEFPEKLSQFARSVAHRYPWITDYTPINEPLTTARFSCLYGLWYPHTRDSLTFARAFLNQCRAVVLAMRAIREVNSDARLVQTEDLGKTFSTPRLRYQALFENERRWLTFDVLTGRLGPGHALWDYFRWLGVAAHELDWFRFNVCPPDIVGINHYVTSERFLDERIARYPVATHGGNGRDQYADVEAVRVCAEGVSGPKALLREAWERYRLPVAITEAHLGCTREEQLRWLHSIWKAAVELRQEAVDVRAITAWATFGSFNWNNLLTAATGHYEPGLYDLRAPSPRATALASMTQSFATGVDFEHPVLNSPGWWQRFDRLRYPPVSHDASKKISPARSNNFPGKPAKPLLIVRGESNLAQSFARTCERRGLAYQLLTSADLDLGDSDSILAALEQIDPWAVVNDTDYARFDDAELRVEMCLREYVAEPTLLARHCKEVGIALLTFSTDLVFDGKLRRPYLESDAPCPLSVIGASKLKAEREALSVLPDALVIRCGPLFNSWNREDFAGQVMSALDRGRTFRAANDVTISPTYAPDLVDVSLDLLIDGERGVWHLANRGSITWADFARQLAAHAGYDQRLIEGVSSNSLGLQTRRPGYSVLGSERGALMPSLEKGIQQYVERLIRSSRGPLVHNFKAVGR